MLNKYEITAQVRKNIGSGASRRLRLDNKIPAILYGGGSDKNAQMLVLNHYHVSKALENEAFYSHILTLDVDGDKQQAVLKDIQRHPCKPKILHMDFLRINANEKIVMNVPLHYKGESRDVPGIKQGGVMTHILSSVEIRCLPKDLPEFIEIDVSQMELDQIIHLSELKLPPNVEIMAFAHGGERSAHDTGVVKIQLPRVIEEAPVEAEAAKAEAVAVPASKQAAPQPAGAPSADKAGKKPEKK
jgi:large subunit ribosomal protein L25